MQNNFDTATRDCNDEIEILKQECEGLKEKLACQININNHLADYQVTANKLMDCYRKALEEIKKVLSHCVMTVLKQVSSTSSTKRKGKKMSNKILQFEPFKNAKKWDDEYAKFLGNTEKYFGAKTNPEQMAKRLYFAMRYLSGVANSFWVCDKLGINLDNSEFEKGKLYCINWLEEILNKLKN